MDAAVIDQATSATYLNKVRDDLVRAEKTAATVVDEMRAALIDCRPRGLLTVGEMAEAIGRPRNYVDRVWSAHHQPEIRNGVAVQTRVPVAENVNAIEARRVYNRLKALGAADQRASAELNRARSERNQAVAIVYGAGILGPSAIAREVGIDRNHVLRIARRLGVDPVHRTRIRNQYSKKNPSRKKHQRRENHQTREK